MELTLVRHGETLENARRICQGQLDGHLSPKGREQIRELARRLKDEEFDAIYSSDLGRAVETAVKIVEHHPDTPFQADERLRERFFGRMQGMPFPAGFDWDALPPFVETNRQMCDRVAEFLRDAYRKHPDGSVMAICHGGTKRALLTVIHGKEPSAMGSWDDPDNASVSVFSLVKGGDGEIRRKAP